MFRRTTFLIATLLFGLALAPQARAHELDAEYKVLPGRKVRVEGWFDLTGAAKGVRVEVLRSNHKILTEGRMDEKGYFMFSYTEAEPLRVIVSAGPGHRKELTIPATELAASPPGPQETATVREAVALANLLDRTDRPPEPPAPRSSALVSWSWYVRVLVGVVVLVAVAVVVLVIRKLRKRQPGIEPGASA
jgi:hypothetical protein